MAGRASVGDAWEALLRNTTLHHSGERACQGILNAALVGHQTQTHQPPLIPAQAGIQLSTHNRMPLKKLDSRLRGCVEIGMRRRPKTRAPQHPLMPAHAGIQLSLHDRKRLEKLDPRVRGNERVGSLAFYRLQLQGGDRSSGRPNRRFLHSPLRGNERSEEGPPSTVDGYGALFFAGVTPLGARAGARKAAQRTS